MSEGKTDILIIRPGSHKELYGVLSQDLIALEPPLWAALLAAYLKKEGFSVGMVDMNVGPEALMPAVTVGKPRFIAIAVSGTNPSASTMNMVGARTILEELKRAGVDIPTILMGLHPSALPERTLREEAVTMVCEGEGFHTLKELLSGVDLNEIRGLWYRAGTSVKSNPIAELIDPDILPIPAWDLLPMDRYRAHNWHSWSNGNRRQPYGVVFTSLGCPFHCSFCCINAIFGEHKIRYRDPSLVIDDIEHLVRNYGVKNIKVLDEMFALQEDHVIRLCDLIIERGYDLNIWVYGRVDTVNEKMLRKMKQAGINWLAVGYESGNKKIRDRVSKGLFDNEKIMRVTSMIKAAGINIVGDFILGLPDDDIESVKDTLKMAKELNCEYTNFYVCMAYPGSKLYAETDPKDLPETWSGYSQFGYETRPLPTKYLTSEDILRFRDSAFESFYRSERYRKMISERFGQGTLDEINEMLKRKLKRKLLGG